MQNIKREKMAHSLFKRYKGNPILLPDDWPYPANAVFNPGATKIGNQTLLLVRVEDMRGFSHLTVARSSNGFTNWHIDRKPTLEADENSMEERFGLGQQVCGLRTLALLERCTLTGPGVCYRSGRRSIMEIPAESPAEGMLTEGGHWRCRRNNSSKSSLCSLISIARAGRCGFAFDLMINCMVKSFALQAVLSL